MHFNAVAVKSLNFKLVMMKVRCLTFEVQKKTKIFIQKPFLVEVFGFFLADLKNLCILLNNSS